MTCIWSAEQIAQALEGEKSGSGWVAKCPCHEDNQPSLSIWAGEGGKTAWDCKAGCKWSDVTRALEKAIPEAFKAQKHNRATIVATYDYFEMTGPVVGQVVRFEPKGFRQRRPNGSGGWNWKMQGLQLPIYRLREIAAVNAVYVVEGEKDVHAMEAIGLPATCNPGGAGKWKEHHTAALAGKRICIIADNDPPKAPHGRQAGQEHALQVAQSLHGTAENIRIILAPSPHKDVSDWIAGGATAETIIAATKAAELWTPQDAPSPPPQTEPTEGQNGDSSDDNPAPHTQHPNWLSGLIYNDKDAIRPILANAAHAMRYAPSLSGIAKFDTFRQRAVIFRETPWGAQPGAVWSDIDDLHLTEWMQINGILIRDAHSAAQQVISENTFDSLQDYLAKLRWDGKMRLYKTANYFGNSTPLGEDVVRMFLISAVARAMRPGCQVDHALVLEGPQGIGKSTALRTLFDPLEAGWFRDHLESVDNKDSAQQLIANWCTEISELSAVNSRRAELEKVKGYISRQIDSYRPPYGRNVQDFPRRNVFAGSTNETTYLRDNTGNRRWWPVPCGKIDLKGLEQDRGQIWAEAVVEFERGEGWWPTQAVTVELVEAQEERLQVDPWFESIEEYTERMTSITLDDLYARALKIEVGKRSQADSNRMAQIMAKLGWVRNRARGPSGLFYRYVRDGDQQEIGNVPSNLS